MAINTPAYRLTVYAPRIEDATETTVLSPIGTAAHADPFIVATLQGVAGAKPYLQFPRGRQGSFDPVTKRTSTGNITVDVFDVRLTAGGSNAVRWSTAFVGDTLGRPRLKGCKFLLEQSLDAGGAWTTYMVGRVRSASVTQPQFMTLDLKDFADDLNRPIFIGIPDTSVASYASSAAILPIGVPQQWGILQGSSSLLGTLSWSSTYGTIVLDASQDPYLGLITKATHDLAMGGAPCVAKVTNIASGLSSYFTWFRYGDSMPETPIPGDENKHVRFTSPVIIPLDASDTRYTAANTSGGAAGACRVLFFLDGPPTPQLPILINDTHPVQLWADLVDGKFSRRPGAASLVPLGSRDTSGGGPWATLIADPSFGTMRFAVDKLYPANDFIEKYILQACNLAYRLDAQGRVTPIDLRRSAALASAVSLTDADLAADADPAWSDSRDGAITAVEISYFIDAVATKEEIRKSADLYPPVPPTMLISARSSVLVANDLSTLKDVGERIVTIEGLGLRALSGETSDTFGLQLRQDDLKKNIRQVAADFLRPFATGTVKARATYRVSGNAASVYQGTYATVQHTKLPDPGTNQRGGARLMLALSRDELDGRINIEWLDCGAAVAATAPAVTGMAAVAGQVNAVDVAVTLNAASDLAEVWTCVTATSVGARPADTADAWAFAGQLTASGTLRASPLPRGARIWVRARSQGNGASLKVPSAWAYPTPGYLDLGAPTAPSALTSGTLLANRLDLTWTIGDPALVVELFQTTGAVPGTWTDAMRLRVLPAGTTKRRVGLLTALTQYSFGVRTRDASGGPSGMATLTVTTTNTPGVAPRPAAIDIATRPSV